jgi:hypothetical protein
MTNLRRVAQLVGLVNPDMPPSADCKSSRYLINSDRLEGLFIVQIYCLQEPVWTGEDCDRTAGDVSLEASSKKDEISTLGSSHEFY